MKKLICVISLILILILALAACSGKSTKNDGQTPSDNHTHTFGEWKVTTAASCTAKGVEKRTCSCGESESRDVAIVGHTYGEWTVTTPATCISEGEETRACICGDSESRKIDISSEHTYIRTPATCSQRATYYRNCIYCEEVNEYDYYYDGYRGPHTLNESNVCAVCKGTYMYFGEYPQTIKADSVTVTDTTDSRGYYLGSDNAYYAKVTATPSYEGYTFSDGSTVNEGTVYYFKVEPILWRILTKSDGSAMIICDNIIANKAFNDSRVNNYAESDIRTWLNDQFYNTAFSALEKEMITITAVDNSAASTDHSTNNPYACENTNDKVFLPSYAEVVNSDYGFKNNHDHDIYRDMIATDYSRATGAWINTSSADTYGNGIWWLRSPAYDFANSALNAAATINAARYVDYEACGVVPALTVNLK